MRHAARIESSERLQRVLSVLEDGEWHGTLEIMQRTSLLCAVGSAISEMRAEPNNLNIECRRVDQGRFEYRFVGAGFIPPSEEGLMNQTPTGGE